MSLMTLVDGDDSIVVAGWLPPCAGCGEADGIVECDGCGDELCVDCHDDESRLCGPCAGDG